MFLFFCLSRSAQPALGEYEFHSLSPAPCSATQSTNCFHNAAVAPSAAATSASVGIAVFPINAFTVSILLLRHNPRVYHRSQFLLISFLPLAFPVAARRRKQIAGDSETEGGGGFNPRNMPTELTRALAPEKIWPRLTSGV